MSGSILSRNQYYDPARPNTIPPHTAYHHERDLADFHLPLAQLHHTALHDWGVAEGLGVQGALGAHELRVSAGVAVDARGRLIVLADGGWATLGPDSWSLSEIPAPATIDLAGRGEQTAYLTIQFHEVLRPAAGNSLPRWEQAPWLQLLPVSGSLPPEIGAGTALVLAIVSTDAQGAITGLQAVDPTLPYRRRSAGQAVEELRLRRARAEGDTIAEATAGTLGAGPAGGLLLAVAAQTDTIVLAHERGGGFAGLHVRADTQIQGGLSVGGNTSLAGLQVTGPAQLADLRVDGALNLSGGPAIRVIAADPALSAASDEALPTQRAVKAYTDRAIGAVGGQIAAQAAQINQLVVASDAQDKRTDQLDQAVCAKADLAGSPGQPFAARTLAVADRLGTNGLAPDSGYPAGWGGGVHTWDLYAEGGVGVGPGGAANATINRDGHAFFAGSVGIGAPVDPAVSLSVAGGLRLQRGEPVSEVSNDPQLSGNSGAALPTQRAVKTYVDQAVAAKAALAGAAGQDFTTRNLTVAGTATVQSALTTRGLTVSGPTSLQGAVSAGSLSVSGATALGDLTASGDIRISRSNKHNTLWLTGDTNHGVGYFGVKGRGAERTFAGASVDGPVVFGWSGGALGSTGNGEKIALAWSKERMEIDLPLFVSGNQELKGSLVVGAGGNGTIRVRHIDGKDAQSDKNDALYLNWNTGKAVVVGSAATRAPLQVIGDLTLDGRLIAANTLFSAKSLCPHTGLPPIAGVKKLAPSRGDAKLLLYDYEAANWAGIGVETGGGIWIRTGVGTQHLAVLGQDGGLYFDGGASCDGKSWWPASSVEYKQDIAALTIDTALTIIADLRPVTFRYKDALDEPQIGFIAEEVPQPVAAPRHRSLSLMGVIGALTRVVQQLQQQVAELQSRAPQGGTA